MKRKQAIEYSNKGWNPYTGCYNWDEKLPNKQGKQDVGVCGLGRDCWFYGMALRLRGRYGYDQVQPWVPTFHKDKLDIPIRRKTPTIWACCFMGDIGYCPDEWMNQIIEVIEQCPQHTFIFLTKMPLLIRNDWPDNVWLGVTVESQEDIMRIEILRTKNAKHRFVSFEPLREGIVCDLSGIEGIAIGAQTGAHPFQPANVWVGHLIGQARHFGCKVVLKDNLMNWFYHAREYDSMIEWP